ncbi:hypothetical protein L3X38_041336 [Prunus dulcis]|uniref:Uncharacterized protein n=1 Tax=Prunus dulcis TaxID=3755 RepID=A0AAD4UTT5_PRUDU|nr:hypothetical protein L3X38_041336 [Prunus dulcis]
MTSTPDTAVLATQCPWGPPSSTNGASQTQVTSFHPEHKCTHCDGSKHTCAGCYKLIGYPDWWDHSKAPCKNKGKSLNTSSDSAPVSPAVPTAPAPASAFVATTGTQSYVLHSSSKKHTWVMFTGATDHVTFDPRQITSHTLSSQSVVSNANGTPSPDILSNKKIGCGPRRGKLYYMDLASDNEASHSQAYNIGGKSVEKNTSEDENIEEFLPAPEISSALVPHQSPNEDVIQVTSFPKTDNINEISYNDLISEGTEPAYQIPNWKNRGKPPVHCEADLNAKGKCPINS